MRISSEREFSLSSSEAGLDERAVEVEPGLLREFTRSAPNSRGLVGAGTGSAEETALIRPRQFTDQMRSGPVAQAPQAEAGSVADLVSRVSDIVLALCLLLVLLPAMALIYFALRLTEEGPALFPHRRIGQGGREFSCLKFRTMCVDADARLTRLLAQDEDLLREWTSKQKLSNDPRVTRFGEFLRITSLDELPQLFNVLRGEMALVGPRPIVANELSRYGRHASDYCKVRPGLTGLWQVTRTGQTTYRRRVATDVHYVRNRTFAYDWKIMAATIPAVLLGNN